MHQHADEYFKENAENRETEDSSQAAIQCAMNDAAICVGIEHQLKSSYIDHVLSKALRMR